jgi:hypothetical protein
MPGRRSFLIGCGCIATGPALAQIDLCVGRGNLPRERPAEVLAQVEMADVNTPEELVLRIDGWDSLVDAGNATDGEVWVRINSSWRSDWH